MPEGLSVSTANSILDAICNAVAYSVATPYVQLHTAAPGAAGTTAIAGNTLRKLASFGVAASGAISNDVEILWSAVGVAEDYTHVTIWTTLTAGTFVASGTITANAVAIGDDFRLPVGDIDLVFPVAS